MKKRKCRNETIGAIEDACLRNSLNLWKIIGRVCPQPLPLNGLTGQEFLDYFKELSMPQYRDYFDYSLENDAVPFLKGRGMLIDKKHNSVHYLEHKIING